MNNSVKIIPPIKKEKTPAELAREELLEIKKAKPLPTTLPEVIRRLELLEKINGL